MRGGITSSFFTYIPWKSPKAKVVEIMAMIKLISEEAATGRVREIFKESEAASGFGMTMEFVENVIPGVFITNAITLGDDLDDLRVF